MKGRRTKWLRRIGLAAVVLVLVVGSAYLLLGWGLKISDRKASYQYIEAWTEAAGRTFNDPFAIAVDPRNGNVLGTDARKTHPYRRQRQLPYRHA